MQINLNEKFYEIDEILQPIFGISWLDKIGIDKYLELMELSQDEIIKHITELSVSSS